MSKNWVITAGHCVDKVYRLDQMTIAGSIETRFTQDEENNKMNIFTVEEKILHPDFSENLGVLNNDIGSA